MSDKYILTHLDMDQYAKRAADAIVAMAMRARMIGTIRAFPIMRGGLPAAYLVQKMWPTGTPFKLELTNDPKDAHIFIDDLIGSGSTLEQWCDDYPEKPFIALIDKRQELQDKWLVFPWESDAVGSFENNITRLLQFVGEDPSRGGLLETPARVTKAWQHWTSGYGKNAGEILKQFEDGAETYDQMVLVKDIPIYSHCEHHLAPIIGTVSIAYIPNGKIVGLSKLSRLADMFARRLQVQERLTSEIADALVEHLEPLGVGVIIRARHLCMESRGVCQQGHHTVTTTLRGAIKDDAQARAEFLQLAG